MKVLNLRCGQDHRFEGWFASEDDYASQTDRGVLQCPLCGDAAITRLPSAPRLSMARSHPGPDEAPPAAAVPAEQQLQARWLHLMRRLVAATDDVGDRFAEEARRIHYGEADERAIRGRATAQETVELRDEGIDVMTLAMPALLKEDLQ